MLINFKIKSKIWTKNAVQVNIAVSRYLQTAGVAKNGRSIGQKEFEKESKTTE